MRLVVSPFRRISAPGCLARVSQVSGLCPALRYFHRTASQPAFAGEAPNCFSSLTIHRVRVFNTYTWRTWRFTDALATSQLATHVNSTVGWYNDTKVPRGCAAQAIWRQLKFCIQPRAKPCTRVVALHFADRHHIKRRLCRFLDALTPHPSPAFRTPSFSHAVHQFPRPLSASLPPSSRVFPSRRELLPSSTTPVSQLCVSTVFSRTLPPQLTAPISQLSFLTRTKLSSNL